MRSSPRFVTWVALQQDARAAIWSTGRVMRGVAGVVRRVDVGRTAVVGTGAEVGVGTTAGRFAGTLLTGCEAGRAAAAALAAKTATAVDASDSTAVAVFTAEAGSVEVACNPPAM